MKSKLIVKKAEQGPVLAAKGDVGVRNGNDGGYGGVEYKTGNNSSVTGGGNASRKEVGVTYRCNY